jgi:hypothetical protein
MSRFLFRKCSKIHVSQIQSHNFVPKVANICTISGVDKATEDPTVLEPPLFGRPHTYGTIKPAVESSVPGPVFLLANSIPIEI